MALNRTAGPDGITVEFFRAFFTIISPLFINVINEIFEKESLTESQKLSYISLLPKDSGPLSEMQNYRPVSLLNVDIKIIAKSLEQKVCPFLGYVIHTDQASAVKGRTITDHNHNIRDIIIYAEEKQIHSSILSLDQRKAFDRVSHEYLHAVLEQINLGTYFRTWIKIMYDDPRSSLLINHTLSAPFSLGRSVRQGDPLSPALYVISLEPFLHKIREDTNIKGITLPGGKIQKVLAFADDANFFPTNNKSIEKIMETSKHFGRASGSEINEKKTQALALGTWKPQERDPLGIKWVEFLKIFGITYKKGTDPNTEEQWKKIVESATQTLNHFYFKQTSVFGRAIIVNTLILPKINYLLQTLDPKNNTIREMNIQIRNFLFKGTVKRIRHNTLIQDKEKGGINLQDIETRMKVYRLKLMQEIIKDKNKFRVGYYYLALKLNKFVRVDNTTPKFSEEHTKGFPAFYKSCISILKEHNITVQRETTKNVPRNSREETNSHVRAIKKGKKPNPNTHVRTLRKLT